MLGQCRCQKSIEGRRSETLGSRPRKRRSGDIHRPSKEPSMRVPTTALAAMMLSLLTTVAPASAFDLTGHWVGKYSCKGFARPYTDDGKLVNKFTTGHSDSTLDI